MPSVMATILSTCNPPAGAKLGFFAKWLVMVRACVFSMTVTSALIGILLAWRDGPVSWGLALLLVLGLLLAHAANNVLNDLLDYRSGVDTADYYRVQYSPHPIHSGMATARQLLMAFALFSFVDFGLMLYFTSLRGPGVIMFAVAGFLVSVLYVGGNYSLKFLGLGEAAVLLVWGPLMVGGVYFVLAGRVTAPVLLASLPYAVLVTTVILGKHVDKRSKDAEKKIGTLPVLLGHDASILMIKGMIVGFYVLILAASLANVIPLAALLALGSIPRAVRVWKTLSAPKPAAAPDGWSIWPLWYVGWCFYLGKLAGGLFIGGMLVQILAMHIWR